MANVINGRSTIAGTVKGQWTQGLSAYAIATQQGYVGTVQQWLESLKGISPKVSDPVEVEGGIQFTITDEDGEHTMFLPDGKDITITESQTLETGEVKVTFSDGSEVIIPKGEKGDPGREVVFSHDSAGNIYWRYNENDDSLKELINLGELANNKFVETFEGFKFVQFVDQLPDPAEADDKVMYILREED